MQILLLPWSRTSTWALIGCYETKMINEEMYLKLEVLEKDMDSYKDKTDSLEKEISSYR